MNKYNKATQCYHKNITNSIFTNVFSQQFPGLFPQKILEENQDVVNFFSSKDNYSENNKINNTFNNDTYADDKRNDINISIKKFIGLSIDDSQKNENKLYNDGNTINDDENYINTEDNIDFGESNNDKTNTYNEVQKQKVLNNDKYHIINFYYDCLDNPFYYYLTRFNYLLSQWKKNGKIDSRYEEILDEIIVDIMNKRYKIPCNMRTRYIIDFSKIAGSGSNGRIFNAIDNITKKEVVLKITLSVYGSSYEEHMLKYCSSEHTVNLIESYNDRVITIFIIDLFGIIW
ncbi:hypothetical protein PIROE2DRAFT_11232 [Piromyces sp. E2]|nr:hypothetical protein PIROE2DRAFT_11232 [Piromyces sp. E2]|eukprot:OUM62478.1 hypothetical protein PIROE2DRAFT_11232 [Piromyces sp. E2]